jgi:hypothetical protein
MFSSMVVHNFDVKGIWFHPTKADAPLIVDSDAVLPHTVAGERLQSIPRNGPQIENHGGSLDLIKLSFRRLGDVMKPPAELAFEDLLGFLVAEGPDH